MIITFTSDLHGHLPPIQQTDVLVIAGDICPVNNHKLMFQRNWLETKFRKWLEEVPAKNIIGIWGNHDLIGEKCPNAIPQLPWTLLQDNNITIEGVTFWGSPWSLNFSTGWAFNASEEELDEKYSKIPKGTDVIISHGPPHGLRDRVNYNRENVGSHALRDHIRRVNPKYVVTGHIHEAYGEASIAWDNKEPVMIVNASYVDENYQPRKPPLRYSI